MTQPKFALVMSLSMETEHSLLYEDKKLGVQMEVHTPVLNPGEGWPRFGKGKRHFSYHGTERTFRTWAACERAMKRRKTGGGGRA